MATPTPAAYPKKQGRKSGRARCASTWGDLGAAPRTIWSPETVAASKTVAVDGDHGDDDLGARAASRKLIFGEEGKEAVAEVAVSFVLSEKERRGGGSDLVTAREMWRIDGYFVGLLVVFCEMRVRSVADMWGPPSTVQHYSLLH